MQRRLGSRVGSFVSALGLLAGFAGCTAGEDLAPSAPRERTKGSYLAHALAERAPPPLPPERPAPAKPRPAPFRSPFGHEIATHPHRHLEASVGGRPLHYWVIGDGPATVLVLGGIHGDERSSVEAAYDLLQSVLAKPQLAEGRRLVVAPEVNPDGFAANSRRNRRDVDLNRNFPAENWRGDDGRARHGPGPHASSEPETRFVLALLRRFAPSCVIATHAAAACVNWDGPAESIAQRMSKECGLPAKDSIGYATPGSLGSFVGRDRAVPTITLELSRKDSVSLEREGVRRALLAAVRHPDAAAPPYAE